MSITIPRFLWHLPVYKGLPVPFTVMWVEYDGKYTPDFRVVDYDARKRCVLEYLCAICGKKMENYWFIGGPKSLEESSLFIDPAMHRVCAEFAIRTCPFLSGRITEANTARPVPEKVGTCPLVTPMRSEKIGMRHARGYKLVNGGGYALILVTQWLGKPKWLA